MFLFFFGKSKLKKTLKYSTDWRRWGWLGGFEYDWGEGGGGGKDASKNNKSSMFSSMIPKQIVQLTVEQISLTVIVTSIKNEKFSLVNNKFQKKKKKRKHGSNSDQLFIKAVELLFNSPVESLAQFS